MTDGKILYGGPVTLDLSQENGSLGEYVLKRLRELDPKKVALIDCSDRKTLTYGQVLEKSLKVAAFLRAKGLKKGDVVSIITENRQEFSLVLFGCFFLGLPVNALNSLYSKEELEHALKLTKPRMLFVASTAMHKIRRIASNFEVVIMAGGPTVQLGKMQRLDKILADKRISMEPDFHPEPVDVKETPALIQMSSGTTGLLKAVVNTQDNVLYAMSIAIELRGGLPSPIERSFATVPFCHTYGLFLLLNQNLGGTTIAFMQKFSRELFLESIQRYKLQSLALVPATWAFLLKSPLVDKYDLSSVMLIGSGAAPLSPEIQEGVNRRFSQAAVRTGQGYGMTEGTWALISHRLEDYKLGSIGSLLPGIYCKVVVPETGRLCGPNEEGELCFKGRVLMRGYLDNEKATQEMLDEEGWLHSGDVGYYDEKEHFFIVERIKELIKYKGFQVAPLHLEDILMGHPGVRDVAVVGIPDMVAGEIPMAFVVKQPKVRVTEKQLLDFVAEKVADHKRLRGGIEFVAAIPRNPNGKILRRELKKLVVGRRAKL